MSDAYGLRIGGPFDNWAYAQLSFTNGVVDASNEGIFGAHYTATAVAITHVGFRYGARTGTPPTFRVSLQSLDANGNPDGTVLGGGSPASATFTPPADATWDGTWQKVALTNSYTPTRGQIVALVIEYSSGTIDASNNSSFAYACSNGAISKAFPVGGNNVSGTWSNKNSRVPVISYYTAAGCYGFPMKSFSSTNYTSTTTPDEYALGFTLPAGWGDTFKLRGIGFWTRGGTASSCEVILYDGTTALQTVTVDRDHVGATVGTADFFFAAAETLTYGQTYRVAMRPLDATGNSCIINTINCETATEASAFDGGPAFFLSSRTDQGAWTDDLTRRPFIELILDDITEPSAGGVGATGAVIGQSVRRSSLY